jgi:hypothetical protein
LYELSPEEYNKRNEENYIEQTIEDLKNKYNYEGIDLIPLIKAIPFDTPFVKDDIDSFFDEFLGEDINNNYKNNILSFYFDCPLWS